MVQDITPDIVVFTGPSGCGKNTLLATLAKLSIFQPSTFSVSVTTRDPREGEVNGVHYHFVELAVFREYAIDNAFVEYAQVGKHFYGTLRSQIEDAGRENTLILADMDVQGVAKLRKVAEEKRWNLFDAFIYPPVGN